MESAALQGLPMERLLQSGPQALSDADLLAVLLSPGSPGHPGEAVARRLLAECGPVRRLAARRAGELAAMPGVGHVRACRLVAAFELGRRAAELRDPDAVIRDASDVHRRWARLESEPEESFVAIAVNARNRIVGEWVVARGWESGVNLHPRQIFTLLVKEGVGRVLFVHNHPSGDSTPSAEDIRFTRKLVEAGRCLEIRVLDHVIVASSGYTSMRAAGLPDLEFG